MLIGSKRLNLWEFCKFTGDRISGLPERRSGERVVLLPKSNCAGDSNTIDSIRTLKTSSYENNQGNNHM